MLGVIVKTWSVPLFRYMVPFGFIVPFVSAEAVMANCPGLHVMVTVFEVTYASQSSVTLRL